MSVDDITPGRIPEAKLKAAEDAARLTLSTTYKDCLPTNPDVLALLEKYYAAHLLFTWGFALPVVSSSVGDVSISKGAPTNLGDKEGSSPYWIEVTKLLECDDDFLVSI